MMLQTFGMVSFSHTLLKNLIVFSHYFDYFTTSNSVYMPSRSGPFLSSQLQCIHSTEGCLANPALLGKQLAVSLLAVYCSNLYYFHSSRAYGNSVAIIFV